MNYSNMENYYKTIFALSFHHKYSIETLENLYPFERDLYAEMIVNAMQEMSEQRQSLAPITASELKDYGLEKYMNKNVKGS